MSQLSAYPPSNPAQAFEDFYVPCIFRPWAGELLSRVKLQSGERILDLACGTGIVARMVARQFNGDVQVTGLDYSSAMLEVARTASASEQVEIEWVEGSAEELPFPDASFDFVLIQQGLQFFRDKARSAGEIYRVLVPAGSVISSTWTVIENNPFNKIFAMGIRRHLGISEEPTAFSLGDRAALKSLFVEAGFDDIEVEVVRRDVRYPSSDQFVDLGIASASAAIPELRSLGTERRAELAEAIRADMAGPIQQYAVGDQLVCPMEAHVVIARKVG